MRVVLPWVLAGLIIASGSGCSRRDQDAPPSSVGAGSRVAQARDTYPAGSQSALAVPGAQVYADNCARCHGADGTGIPGFLDQVQKLPEGDIRTWIRKGGRGMPGMAGTLSDAKIAQAAAYTKTLRPKAP